MSTLIRLRLAAALAALTAVSSTAALAAPTPSRQPYTISGDLSVVVAAPSGNGLTLQSRLTALPTSPMQSGNGFTLAGDLAESPLICLSDIIFQDGFGPVPR